MLRILFLLAILCGLSASAFSQGTTASLRRGFEATAPAVATAEELAQGDLWVMEVDFKPVRLIRVATTDPQTGEKREELFWYIVYRAVNKSLKSPAQNTGTLPVNNYDPAPGPSLLIPEFTLVTDDAGRQQVYPDVVIPEAEAAIARREMRGADRDNVLKNTVEVVQPVRPTDDKAAAPIYGMAMWRGIDPETDSFKVYAGGFSNGYREAKGPDGKPLILRREIVLDYWRPGDEFDPNEREFLFRTQPRWIYRADEAAPTDPGQDALKAASAAAATSRAAD
ncbi:MAG: hypothetical protein M3552_08185 [Planctomycetota bacterium]|nr:hypothetical protein [Planctomycetaceae bacterium]MDQ3330617.1 hypothetical protein [Planctomycetota bacterium]